MLILMETWLYFSQGHKFALERLLAVMVIACPHVLGLTIALVVAISKAISAQNGLLFTQVSQLKKGSKCG